QLAKRDGNARFTYYGAGLGACGGTNSPSDYVRRLFSGLVQQWDGGKHCYEQITIKFGGKTVHAQIVDECPECPTGALDLSQGLFAALANLDDGVVYGEWEYD
ncbi:hypothetical protein FISHEDRAFT_5280, partial [Fistulina hepatica ATCC 64428]